MNKKANRGRPNKTSVLLNKLKALGLFDLKAAKQAGVSQATLSRWVASGKIIRDAPGIYSHHDVEFSHGHHDYAVACARFGNKSVIGGMTALFHYQLIEQVPTKVWIMVPYSVITKDPLYRCIRTKTNPHIGVDDRGEYRITNLERTLVEALRYSSKIGLRVALKAVRTAIKEKQTTLPKVLKQAKALGLEKFVLKHWESLVPEGEAE